MAERTRRLASRFSLAPLLGLALSACGQSERDSSRPGTSASGTGQGGTTQAGSGGAQGGTAGSGGAQGGTAGSGSGGSGGSSGASCIGTGGEAPGAPDSSFGAEGVTVVDVQPPSDAPTITFGELELASDGKIIGVGYDDDGCFVFRLDAGGNPDATFGSAGLTRIDTTGYCQAVALDAQGSLLLAGTETASTLYDAALWRLTPEGQLDADFGNQGKTVLDLGSSNDRFVKVLPRPDGSIVALGIRDANGATPGPVLSFFDAMGESVGDPTELDAGSDRNVATDLAEQPDDTLLALIWGQNEERAHFAAVDGSGVLVPSFGEGGFVRSMPGSALSLIGLGAGADGELYAWGTGAGAALVNIGVDGSAGGFNGQTTMTARSIAVQCDGKVLAAGTAQSGDSYPATLERLLADGAVDESFGAAGRVAWPGQGTEPYASSLTSVLIQSDQKILAGGVRDRTPFVARVWP